MKDKIIAVFLAICFLSACNRGAPFEKNIPASKESVAAVSSETAADGGQIEDHHPVLEKPDLEMYLSPEYWREYYLFTMDYGYPDEYSRESGDINVRRLFNNIRYLFEKGFISHDYPTVDWKEYPTNSYFSKCIQVPQTEFFYWTDKYYGSVDRGEFKQEYAQYVDEEQAMIYVQTDAAGMLRFFPERYIIDSVRERDGGDVEVAFRRMTSLKQNLTEYSAVAIMRWDDRAGFVVQELTKTLIEESAVSAEGDYATLESLFGSTPDTGAICDLAFFGLIDGDWVYRVHHYVDKILYESVNLKTLEEIERRELYDFNGEKALTFTARDNLLDVTTDAAFYRFDNTLKLIKRVPWPQSILSDERAEDIIRSCMVSPSATVMCYGYYGDGVYICGMDSGAKPRLLAEHPIMTGDELKRESYSPHRFLDDERVMLNRMGWEWLVSRSVFDLRGNILDTVDIFEIGYGDIINNPRNTKGVIIHNPTRRDGKGTFYYDYQSLKLSDLAFLDTPPFDMNWTICFLLEDYCVIGISYFEEFTNYPEKTEFYRVDLKTEETTKLPLVINGAWIYDATVFSNGYIMFYYTFKEESGAGIYKIPEKQEGIS